MVTLVLAGHTRAGSICGAELGMTIKRLAEMGLGVRGIQVRFLFISPKHVHVGTQSPYYITSIFPFFYLLL